MIEHPIFDGLKLYKRDGVTRAFWYCYFLHNGRVIRRSMKTAELQPAIEAAVELFRRFRSGQADHEEVRKPSFAAVAASFLEANRNHTDYANKETVVRRFFVPFFHGELSRRIDAITQADITGYLEWRRSYHSRPKHSSVVEYERNGKRILAKRQEYKKPPAGKTLNRENIALRQLFAYAVEQGWLTKDRAPTVPALKQVTNRREAISPADYDCMVQTARQRVDEAPDERQRHQRLVLLDFIVIVRHTGLRPHEAVGLTWADVRLADLVLRVRGGKTGKRDVALIDDEVIERLRAIRERHEAAQEGEFDPAQPVFAGIDGKPTQSVKGSFIKLVSACAFTHAVDYTPYGLRHLFATDMVGRGCADGVLAKLMGTSRRMLDNFYDQSNVEMARKWVKEREQAGRHLRRPAEDDELKLLDPDLDNRLLVMGEDGLLRVEVA